MSKGTELSYKLGYLITAVSFCPVCPDIIPILWICDPNSIQVLWISTLRGHYTYFIDIIDILWILWIYMHFVDIISIGNIKSYLPCNICPIFQIYSSIVCEWSILRNIDSPWDDTTRSTNASNIVINESLQEILPLGT